MCQTLMSFLIDCCWVQNNTKLGLGLTVLGGVIDYCLCRDWSLCI